MQKKACVACGFKFLVAIYALGTLRQRIVGKNPQSTNIKHCSGVRCTHLNDHSPSAVTRATRRRSPTNDDPGPMITSGSPKILSDGIRWSEAPSHLVPTRDVINAEYFMCMNILLHKSI